MPLLAAAVASFTVILVENKWERLGIGLIGFTAAVSAAFLLWRRENRRV